MRLRRPGLRTPAAALAALVVAQWAAVASFASTVPRNGWLFYQGGDQTWFYAYSWILGGGELPPAYIGYVYSLLFAPLAQLLGPSMLPALPAYVLFQVIVLLPVALFCVYGIASLLGGRALGLWAAALWVVAPYAAIPLWDPRYHERYVDQFLPQGLGLAAMGDFPSMVAVLVSAFFVVRALERRLPADAVAAGLAAGVAVGIKPANAIFLAAPVAAWLVARRPRELGAFAAGCAPALLALAVWKLRGLGELPLLALPETQLAAAPAGLAVDRYLELDWRQLHRNEIFLREYFWSVRLLEWLPLAGVVAVARRSPPAAALLGVWFVGFVVAKGTSPLADVQAGTFLRLLMPAFPAFLLLAALVPLLVPTLGRRLPHVRLGPPGRRLRALLVAGVVVFALVPLVAVATAVPSPEPRAVWDPVGRVFVPLDGFDLSVGSVGVDDALSWEAPERGRSDVFYLVYRERPGRELECSTPPRDAPVYCVLAMELVGRTRLTEWEGRPPPGRWTYRVGLAANYLDDADGGDLLLLSRAARAGA